jgi:uncharacterized protein YutE (UPF0331/DUF86 family)
MYLAGDMSRGVEAALRKAELATRGIASGTFTVNRDNVLAAGRIIESQADALFDLWKDRVEDLRIDPPGTDEVSIRMANAWNDRLVEDEDSYKNRVKDYVIGLRKLAIQLGDAAKSYGYTEDEISAAFGKQGA